MWSVQVNFLLSNCKHNNTSLSFLIGTTVINVMYVLLFKCYGSLNVFVLKRRYNLNSRFREKYVVVVLFIKTVLNVNYEKNQTKYKLKNTDLCTRQ